MSRVTWARAGDTVNVLGIDGRIHPVMLWPRCPVSTVVYWCEGCRIELRHVGALVDHLAVDAAHHIAIRCPHNGGEGRWECADEAQMRALVGVPA